MNDHADATVSKKLKDTQNMLDGGKTEVTEQY